ncbi:MAG: hypothetical protein IBX47_12185 [Desulfuromonadales bacterium]|nr:hypothetical protein [Desulfuromonadales bacterium]
MRPNQKTTEASYAVNIHDEMLYTGTTCLDLDRDDSTTADTIGNCRACHTTLP